MKQSPLDLSLCTRKTRKQVFLQQMETVVPWAALVELIAPYYSDGRNGRPPFALETMLRVHFMQQWFSLSDPAMEEAFFDTPLYREFAQLSPFGRLPDESTILRFRHRLEKHKLAERILASVNELLEQRGLLLKAGTAVDADSGLVHTVCGTSGNVSDAPVSGHQVPVWLQAGALSGLDEEHLADQDAVCALQSVDGATQADGCAGMSASKNWINGAEKIKTVLCQG